MISFGRTPLAAVRTLVKTGTCSWILHGETHWAITRGHCVHDTFDKADSGARVIYLGSDFDLFQQGDAIPQVGDCIGTVYRLEPDKIDESAIEPFIEIVKRRPTTRVLTAGGGHFLDSIKMRLSQMNLSDSFEFTGYVPYTTLPDLYGRLKAFVAPVWKVSFGRVFAMNMGIAVVGDNVGAISEIVGDPTLTASHGDAAPLADIAVQLLDDNEQRVAVGRRKQARASELFSIHAMIDCYRTLYADMMLRPRL